MSSPSLNHPQMKCYPQRDRKDNRKRCVGRTPATPGSSRDASSRPPPRPPGQGRCEEDAHRGFGPVARAACSGSPAGPRPRQPTLLNASGCTPAADHPGPALFTSGFSRSHAQKLPRGSPATGSDYSGFQPARTGPSRGRSRRPGGA